jgi:hypothetical protein
MDAPWSQPWSQESQSQSLWTAGAAPPPPEEDSEDSAAGAAAGQFSLGHGTPMSLSNNFLAMVARASMPHLTQLSQEEETSHRFEGIPPPPTFGDEGAPVKPEPPSLNDIDPIFPAMMPSWIPPLTQLSQETVLQPEAMSPVPDASVETRATSPLGSDDKGEECEETQREAKLRRVLELVPHAGRSIQSIVENSPNEDFKRKCLSFLKVPHEVDVAAKVSKLLIEKMHDDDQSSAKRPTSSSQASGAVKRQKEEDGVKSECSETTD